MVCHHSLEEKLLEAFELALAKDRMDVAEHLLRALEACGHVPGPHAPLIPMACACDSRVFQDTR
jgi:hypothetical protein